jgi:hypothetical protein
MLPCSLLSPLLGKEPLQDEPNITTAVLGDGRNLDVRHVSVLHDETTHKNGFRNFSAMGFVS